MPEARSKKKTCQPRLPGSTTNQAMSSSGSISSGCQTFEHWRLRTRGAIKPKPACEQRERKWQLSPKNSDSSTSVPPNKECLYVTSQPQRHSPESVCLMRRRISVMSTTVYSIPARSIARKAGIELGAVGEERLTERLGRGGLRRRRTRRHAP